MIETKKLYREKILWVSILILFSLAASCTTKKTASPVPPTVYLMKDYFPLNQRDECIWEVTVLRDSIEEPYVDGDINLGEPFMDLNGNGLYDFGEPFTDSNGNGKYDGPNDPWTPGVPYWDRNNNDKYDAPNGKYDDGELFSDVDSNGTWNWILNFHTGELKGGIDSVISLSPDGRMIFIRRLRFPEADGDSVDGHTADGLSNDSSGLKWHWHAGYWFHFEEDDFYDREPIIIAKSEIVMGNSVANADTSYEQGEINHIRTWTSTLEAVEDVSVPAGDFPDCLKFKTVASGWKGNMAGYNGSSYQWYAKDVGLVKLEGPKTGEYWQLESATIDGQSYP